MTGLAWDNRPPRLARVTRALRPWVVSIALSGDSGVSTGRFKSAAAYFRRYRVTAQNS
jgi:hypothetical protein